MDAGLAHLVSWCEPTKGDVPPPLTGPSITISPLPAPHPPTVFLFGGKSVQTRRLTSEMWAMNIGTRVWERVDAGEGPGPRYFHSMDVWEDKLVCFGGMSDSDPMSVHNDIWFFDCLSRQWLPQPAPGVGLGISPTAQQDPSLLPSARYAHLSSISRGKLIISGGQHSDNSWIYEINVYDLKKRVWESKTEQPEIGGLHSKGAYRSVSTSSKMRVVTPHVGLDFKAGPAHSYSVDEEGEGGDVWCYSNYDFAKVRRELEVISPDLSSPSDPSDKHVSPPSFDLRDESERMRGHSQPPGLRFPTGGIVGNNFILCGLYLASSSAAFSIWALNLDTMIWRHLEPSVLSTGSWNRAVLWPEKARILVFGNNEYDLASDYSRRAVNLDHIAVISLEAYGIYQPPKLEVPAKIQQAGLTMLDEKLASDFEVICDDGRRVKCSRQILSERWPWFAEQEQSLSDKAAGVLAAAPAVDINDTLLGSFTPARLAPTNLTLPEPFPVCVALVQYFYTLSLATPLQNRAPVLSALLFLAKQYKIDRLQKLVIHALHERLEPSIAVGIYEIATLAGEQCLQVRALNMIHSAKNAAARNHRQGPSASQNIESGSSSTSGQPNITPTGAQTSTEASSNPSTGTRGGPVDDVPYRRARADSFTVPDEILFPGNLDMPSQDGLHVVEDVHEERDEQVNALLAALDVNQTIRRKASLTPSEASLAFTPSLPDLSAPVPPRRYPLRLPIPAPNPGAYRSTPLPMTPDVAHSDRLHRSSSPTNSDVTSNFPSTPAESLRESWIVPPSRDFSASMGDSRSSSSSGHGLPPLPEFGPTDHYGDSFSMRRNQSMRTKNREALIDPLADGKKLNTSTLEAAGLLPPVTPPPQSFSNQQARAMESLSSHHTVASYYFEAASSPSGLSRATSSGSISASPKPNRSRQFSIMTDSSSGQSTREIKLGSLHNSNTPSTTSIPDQSTSTLYRPPTLASTFNDGSSISSGSTGTSSKRAAKAEMKQIRQAEKDAKKAEAQARFEALRAEQAKKMAILKAESQRKAEIKAKEQQAVKKEEKAPKSKWGKLGKGLTDAVLFPSSGSSNQMF
ncbi:regulatory protein ral2 [Kwoniella heveanensis CBS 569]|nr:regulatory protein ral2 [Kwoniella heveanensis CBS 569]